VESGTCEEAGTFPSWDLLRLADLAAQLGFLEPLKLVFIDNYRNTPSCDFLCASDDPTLTYHEHWTICSQGFPRHFNRELDRGIHLDKRFGVKENSPG
jgi:hypothetical protein